MKDIFDLIGVEMVDRQYQGEKALCCGSMLRVGDILEASKDVQKRNIEDMVKSKAEYCVFNCPICLQFMAEGVMKSGIKPIHITDLCRIALGEKIDNGGQTK